MSGGDRFETYAGTQVPASERCFKLELKPMAWKARLWRAFDDSTMPMLRLDAPLTLRGLAGDPLHGLLQPFERSLRTLAIYLERGAGAPLPLAWSVGNVRIDHERAVVWLHRVLDDPFGQLLGTLFRPGEAMADVTLSMSLYERSGERIVFALRDYDIGFGGGFVRGG
ncbi:MAG: hypothetical protein HY056_16910 [Proteobacteria bacterium]|nr:hypothetical protein [Pseudomonadota bacterium]